MDVEAVTKAVRRLAKLHWKTFQLLSQRQTLLLELGGFVGVMEHFRALGYDIKVRHPKGAKTFRLKASTRGMPWDFSSVECSTPKARYELHSNLQVRGAHDQGIYCVDIAVVRSGSLPVERSKLPWKALANADLVTFAEVKKLVVYPMLLAQFIGIVHEIRPEFLRKPPPRGHTHRRGFPPTLITLGHLSGNSDVILKGFRRRGFTVVVTPDYDFRLARLAIGEDESPFLRTYT